MVRLVRNTLGMDLAKLRDLLRSDDPRASAALESILAFETTEWITVYFNDISDDKTGDSRIAGFLRGEELERARGRAGYDFSPGDGHPGFVTWYSGEDDRTEYWPVGQGDYVPLVHVRLYNAPFPRTVEIAEDFRLCWDLYEDSDAREWVTVDEVGGSCRRREVA